MNETLISDLMDLHNGLVEASCEEGQPVPRDQFLTHEEATLLASVENALDRCQTSEELAASPEVSALAQLGVRGSRDFGRMAAAVLDVFRFTVEIELDEADREAIQEEGEGRLEERAEPFSSESWYELLAADANRCFKDGADLPTTTDILLERVGMSQQYGVSPSDAMIGFRNALRALFPTHPAKRLSPLRAFTSPALHAMDFPPREVVLEPYLGPGETVLIHGGKGVGKTWVATGQAAALAAGGTFLGWRCREPQNVLYLDGEMFGPAMDARLEDLRRSAGLERSERLRIYTPDTQEPEAPALNLFTDEGRKMVEDLIDDIGGIDWLVLDNLSSLFRGWDENEAASWDEAQGWLLWLRQKQIGATLVHHDNKAGEQRGTSKRLDVMHHVLKVQRAEGAQVADGAWFAVRYEYTRYKPDGCENFEARLEGDVWTVKGLGHPAVEEIVRLKKEGLGQNEIARRTGVARTTVQNRIKKLKEAGRIP